MIVSFGMNCQVAWQADKTRCCRCDGEFVGGWRMPNVYVEPRPKGRPEGSHIEDFVVEDHADHILASFKTQREAIDWARGQGHAPLVARVRHLNDKKRPDHWRSA